MAHYRPVPHTDPAIPLNSAPTGLREAKKARTRASLALSALELAAEVGLQATTVDAIATRADVSARTFFNYFDSKDDAVVHLGTDRFRRLMTRLFTAAPDPGTNPVIQIRDQLLAHLREPSPDSRAQDELLRLALERDSSLFATLHASMTTIGDEFNAAITGRYDTIRDRELARIGLSVALSLTQTAMLESRTALDDTPIDERVAHYFRLLESALG